MSLKTPITEIAARLWNRPRTFVGRISFESRSVATAAAARGGVCRKGILFVSEGRSDIANEHVRSVKNDHPGLKIVELKIADPLATADAINSALTSTSLVDAVIDVTTFRREELLVLLEVLRSIDSAKRRGCELVYVSAGQMADTLSGNVTQTRSIVGFAGEIWPSKPTTLVVLMGFEIPRARAIIETYEPRYLILGRGKQSESINEDLWKKNDVFFRELTSSYANVEDVFEFSARDPLAVAEQLENAITTSEKSNVVLAPLHTKLSTIGVALYAQRHRNAQVCYAEVGVYNEEAYSTVGDDAYVFSLTQLFRSTA
jgi:hypothetical protein